MRVTGVGPSGLVRWLSWFPAAATDLLLGGRCVGCGEPGRPLCRPCRADLPGRAWPAWPDPVPAGLVDRLGLRGVRRRASRRSCSGSRSGSCSAWSGRWPRCWRRRPPPRPAPVRSCSCRCRRARPPSGPVATTPPAPITSRAARLLAAAGHDVIVAAAAPPATRCRRPGRARCGRAGRQPGRLDDAAPAPRLRRLGGAPRPGPGGGLRRRADHRLDRPGGPARPRGGRPGGRRHRRGRGHPAAYPERSAEIAQSIWALPFRPQRDGGYGRRTHPTPSEGAADLSLHLGQPRKS